MWARLGRKMLLRKRKGVSAKSKGQEWVEPVWFRKESEVQSQGRT